MNASTDTNWYFAGEYGNLEDFTPEELEAARIFVEKFKAEAPAEFVYTGPKEEAPFGEWYRKDDEFGGTYVVLMPANPSDAIPEDREFPAGLAMWIYVNLSIELADLTPNWNNVDSEVRGVLDAWESDSTNN